MIYNDRLEKLKDLDIKIRVALLGEPETRHDLLDLQRKVRHEIRKITLPQMANQ